MADQVLPYGRLMSGLFGGVHPVEKKDGTTVDNLLEMVVVEPAVGEYGEETLHRASFFVRSRGTHEPTRMKVQLDDLKLQPGDPVIVKYVERVSQGNDGRRFVNFTAVGVVRAPGAVSRLKPLSA
ncbi:MAG TPA: hypothetical protein VHT30_01540 [Acidimicrobiales bacterium]|nr:hypothetical protein [Acidimicrobiales bacterium]